MRRGVERPAPHNPRATFPYLPTQNPPYYYWSPPPPPGLPQPPPPSQNPRFLPPPASYLNTPAAYHRPQLDAAQWSGNGGSQELLGRAEAALAKAHRDLLTAGESVSAWRVSQSALLALKADSWAALGFQFQDVPYLRRLVAIEGKVSAFIHCFVGVRRIASVHDLDVEICKNEGIEQFDTLGLGPLLRHPLVIHYFSVPPDTSVLPKIRTEDIISCLSSYMNTSGRTIVAEEFLNFLMEKHAVNSKEKLGVRIQSLGMHIAFIREAKKAENTTLGNSTKGLKCTLGNKTRIEGRKPTQASSVIVQKKVLDRRFGFISKRMKSFSSACDIFEGKHIKFDSSDDDDSGSDSKACDQSTSQSSNGIQQRVSSCPYPSTTEEIERLGLKNEMAEKLSSQTKVKHNKIKKFSGRKRKFEEQNIDRRPLSLTLEEAQVVCTNGIENQKEQDIVLTSSIMEKFITMWKEACRKYSVPEILDMMLNFYDCTVKKKKKMRKIFSSFPGIGLLNVAVASIKCGMHDSIYEIFQDIEEHGFNISKPASREVIEIEVPVRRNEIPTNSTFACECECSFSIDDIIIKLTNYFQHDHLRSIRDHPLGNKFTMFRTLHDCEIWLAKEFSVDVFPSLGHGHFVDFLEKNIALIPSEVRSHFVGDSSRTHLEVAVDQLQVFLSQAQINSVDNGVINQAYFLMLVGKQFPTLRLHFIGDETECYFQDLVRRQKESGNSNSVFYSSALLGKYFIEKSKTCMSYSSEAVGMINEPERVVSLLCPVSGKDAIECLLKAPMLSDLRSWSHWDLIFAPTLGPLLEWLTNETHNEELLCIATTDGRLIRIDHSATVDEFLEASIQGSPFHAAVKLLSLLALYGGTCNTPVALVKCYAQRAMDVIVRNFMDSEELCHPTESFLHGSSFKGCVILGNNHDAPPFSADTRGILVGSPNKGFHVAARFVIDCLDHLPSEFRIFAAEILMSGLHHSIKDASFVMLRECKQANEQIMLHEIGLSLGIAEWIANCHLFNPSTAVESLNSFHDQSKAAKSAFPSFKMGLNDGAKELFCKDKRPANLSSDITKSDWESNPLVELQNSTVCSECSNEGGGNVLVKFADGMVHDAALIIESIRREEFGLDPNSEDTESSLLKKQHARLGRALHCLSQELYSQDSHLLLELVQNADDNTYPETVEPTLVFILQSTSIIVLNNEQGFSAENIKALCDVGNSTKKGSGAGYIGHKGIGFKSVFRVTDAPEIHSNGFHVKFDVSEGQIGFVLPTVVPPCDIGLFVRLVSSKVDQTYASCWKTCIVLPFRSKLKEKSEMSSIISMFSDLHPSLLLFLHRLQCIKFKNMLNNSFIIMRKETLGDGIVRVSFGSEKMNWLVVRKKLQANIIRPDVETTEIAMAFTFQESETGEYKPYLSEQPVFAFLPLRMYGLKFILQGDFVLPSSREEVDGDSAWNQWLLSEFPALFVNAEQDFSALPCFKRFPGKAVTAFMSFVPLVGEVHGFFSYLPHMIVSKLRTTNCLLLEGHGMEWVPPCRVLRGWDEQARALLSDSLLLQHLGLGYLNKDIILSDSLAKALCIREYGPRILTDVMSSICHANRGIQQLGLDWLSNWFTTLDSTMLRWSSGCQTQNDGMESDVISTLKRIPFIPLSDGSYGSIAEGPIWLSLDSSCIEYEGKHSSKDFPSLHAKLRTVNPVLFTAAASYNHNAEESRVDSILHLLRKIGVQKLSAHEVIRRHILPALSDANYIHKDKNLMVEYLSYVMLHFQHVCSSCQTERMWIISELRNNFIILTNHGFKCPLKEPVHFSNDFGNPVDVNRLIDPEDGKWNEIDGIYLKHYSTQSISSQLLKWREFFQELGVTDFVQVIPVEKSVKDFLNVVPGSMSSEADNFASGSLVHDWESPELIHLLSAFSSRKEKDKCRYLLEVLDKMWDECFSSEARNYGRLEPIEGKHPLPSSFLKCLHEFRWIMSSVDGELHYPKDLFYDCGAVRSVLGSFAPYAVPQVKSKRFLDDIGFKTQVTPDDALATVRSWEVLEGPVLASPAQMSKFYSFICEGASASKMKMIDEFKSHPFIFIPASSASRYTDTVSGTFVSSTQVYWHDPTGCVDQVEAMLCSTTTDSSVGIISRTLANVYPNLHEFFVNMCGVQESPPFSSYIQILLQLSSVAPPSKVAHHVFQVFLKWVDDLKAGKVQTDEIVFLKESLSKLENTILPTMMDKWVSLHPTFGLICWSDNEELRHQFRHSQNVDFIKFGELSNEDMEMLSTRVSKLLQKIGVPALSEVVSREAIFYGTEDCREKTSLVNWVLPYAQRYIVKLYPDKYLALKKSVVERLALLQIVAVDKLFYKYRIKGCSISSRKRFECSCLLQDGILYLTRTSDCHSIFLELSRVFFDGSAELHFANFLHMITTMAESGSTEEQIEFFIVNSQKVPKLPLEEPVWSLLPSSLQGANTPQRICSVLMHTEQNTLSHTRKLGIIPNWPPTDWRTAPGFPKCHVGTNPGPVPYDNLTKESNRPHEVAVWSEDISGPVEIHEDWIIEDNSEKAMDLNLDDSATPKVQSHSGDLSDFHGQNESRAYLKAGTDDSVPAFHHNLNSDDLEPHSWRETLGFQAMNDNQSRKTGVLGETIAYKYFCEKFSSISVKWVNEEAETGLPYDLIIGDKDGSSEFVEVKATRSATKDWFPITTREWLFAVEKGEHYSIAHVVLLGPKNVKITVWKNPLRLCQKNVLRLAVLMPKQ